MLEMEVLQGEMAFSMSPKKKNNNNSPPGANQGLSKPRHHHTVCTIWVHPPISPHPAPPFLLTQRTLPEVI